MVDKHPTELLRDSGIHLTPLQTDQLQGHLVSVLRAAESMNLTSIRDPHVAFRLHVLDSLLAAPFIAQASEGRLLDIGSGAGYPGIPLSIGTGRTTTLLEATRKKCSFLEGCIASVGLASVDVRCGRAEEIALQPDMREAFAVVVSRAVADLPVLLELSAPFLEEGGLVVSMKGRLLQDEISRGDAAAALVGLQRVRVDRYALPGGEEERAAVVYQRSGPPAVLLPRRVGLANKRPLG